MEKPVLSFFGCFGSIDILKSEKMCWFLLIFILGSYSILYLSSFVGFMSRIFK